MKNKNISPVGDSWEGYKGTLLTPEERAEIDIRVALVGEILKARHKSGLTQKELEEASGVKQPVIARMERGTTDPQLSTILKVLAPLGKTLGIVSLKKKAG
jgi:ribosome-binding protein aMBF1 (putative translation factor)